MLYIPDSPSQVQEYWATHPYKDMGYETIREMWGDDDLE
jgi:hypothetical protein